MRDAFTEECCNRLRQQQHKEWPLWARVVAAMLAVSIISIVYTWLFVAVWGRMP